MSLTELNVKADLAAAASSLMLLVDEVASKLLVLSADISPVVKEGVNEVFKEGILLLSEVRVRFLSLAIEISPMEEMLVLLPALTKVFCKFIPELFGVDKVAEVIVGAELFKLLKEGVVKFDGVMASELSEIGLLAVIVKSLPALILAIVASEAEPRFLELVAEVLVKLPTFSVKSLPAIIDPLLRRLAVGASMVKLSLAKIVELLASAESEPSNLLRVSSER